MLGALALVCLGVYGYLVGVLTYSKVVGESAAHQPVAKKVIGGFRLTDQAKAALRNNTVTVQKLFAGAAYDEDTVWTRPSRALAKLCFQFAYIGLIGTGTPALAAAAILVTSASGGADLAQATEHWLAETDKARQTETVTSGPLPTSLVAGRTVFEAAWQDTGLDARRKLDQEKLAKALSYLIHSYQLQEKDSPTQENALGWADAAIQYFGQTQDRKRLTEALLDKAAVYLDLAQLANNNRADFEKNSQSGEAVIARAMELADAKQKPQVLRIASRFYYNLARPKSFRLSEDWDNNYLLQACEKARAAVDLAAADIGNANQLLRATMKASKNPPQDHDKTWGLKLRAAKNAMKAAWDANKERLKSRDDRLSPLDVLGVGTLETLAREWDDATDSERAARAQAMLQELETDSLVPLREAVVLLATDKLRKSYGFDLYYDIARAQAQRVVMLRTLDVARAKPAFGDVIANLRRAREGATATQVDAALKDIDRDLSLSRLEPDERSQLRPILQTGG